MTDANFPMRCAIYSCMCAQYLRSDRLCRSLLLLLRVLSDCACSEKKETLRRSLFPRARDNVCWSRRKSGVVATIDSNFPGQNSSVILFLRLFLCFFVKIGKDILKITVKKNYKTLQRVNTTESAHNTKHK